MTLSMACFSLLPSPEIILLVISVGFIATLFESVLGASFQNRFPWLTNELINAVQTLFSAIFAMVLANVFGVINLT